MVHCSFSHAPTILCCFSEWLSKCARTPGCHLYLQHVEGLLHSDNVVATWWERHAWEICLRCQFGVFFFLYMCETISSQHNRRPPSFMGYLCSGGPFVIYRPNHYSSFTTLLTLTAIWRLETDFELCFNGNQSGFLRTEAFSFKTQKRDT